MNWRNSFEEVKKVNTELRDYGQSMTPYEFHVMSQERINKINGNRAVIEQGIRSEVQKAIGDHQDARRWLKMSEQTEINSWDLGKLNTAHAVNKVLLDFAVNNNTSVMVGTSDRVGSIWREVEASGDKYRIRAFSELVGSVQNKISDRDEARRINQYVMESNKALESIRITPQMTKFAQQVQDTYDLAAQRLCELREVNAALGDQSSLGDFERSIDQFIDPDDNLPHVRFVESEGQKYKYTKQK